MSENYFFYKQSYFVTSTRSIKNNFKDDRGKLDISIDRNNEAGKALSYLKIVSFWNAVNSFENIRYPDKYKIQKVLFGESPETSYLNEYCNSTDASADI